VLSDKKPELLPIMVTERDKIDPNNIFLHSKSTGRCSAFFGSFLNGGAYSKRRWNQILVKSSWENFKQTIIYNLKKETCSKKRKKKKRKKCLRKVHGMADFDPSIENPIK